jgi:hypothetical protein
MVAGEGAEKGTSEARTKISESGLSGPALTKAFKGVSEMAVKAKAGATQDVWKMAQDYLQKLSLAPPFATTIGRESGGGGTGYGLCSSCYIFKSFNEGYLEEDVRLFRDVHYPKGGFVDSGYRWMSNWLVPAMEKYPSLKHIIRWVMIWPLSQYARWYYGKNHFGYVFTPLRYFWPKTWEMIGRLTYLREVK